MSTKAIVTMVIVAGFIWGGFAALLLRALRTERIKRRAEPRD